MESTPGPTRARSAALRFVVMIGVVSLFADMVYEGARSITGPYLLVLGASAVVVGVVAGLGELLGYGFRFVSGRFSERTGQFWPVTLFGYFLQMTAVPALALAGSWPAAAVLIVLERMGKAIRNPPRDVMLSHAGREIGIGWAFGLKEGLDQTGALIGPLIVALFLLHRAQYRMAFAVLLIPALITAALIVLTKFLYPRPEDLSTEPHPPSVPASGMGRRFWIYLAGASLVAAGFADYQLIAYHLQKHGIASIALIPVFYSVAMAAGGAGSMLFGRLFDRFGISVLIPLTSSASCPRPWSSSAASGWPWPAPPSGDSAWAFMKPSFPPPWPAWSLPNAALPPTASSPPPMESSGSSAASPSASSTTVPSTPPSSSAS